jgi:hypothetical protein
MRSNITSGRSTVEHYTAYWRGRLEPEPSLEPEPEPQSAPMQEPLWLRLLRASGVPEAERFPNKVRKTPF